MPKLLTPDLCVIGAGPGGLAAAAKAASYGMSVVLIERGRMGGQALIYGLGAFEGAARVGQTRPRHQECLELRRQGRTTSASTTEPSSSTFERRGRRWRQNVSAGTL